MADPTAIVDAVKAGDYDDELAVLLEAVLRRAADTETAFSWQIDFDGEQWNVETVTLQELGFAERTLSTPIEKVSYLDLDPIRSMDHLVALIVAHLHVIKQKPLPAAFAQARNLTLTDLDDIVSIHEVNSSPKDDGGRTSTDS